MKKLILLLAGLSLATTIFAAQAAPSTKMEKKPRLAKKYVSPELQCQQWLKSFNRNYTIDQIKNLKTFSMQLYGKLNGISTQTLFSNENMKHLQVMKNLETLRLPTWTNDSGLSNIKNLTNLKTLNAPNCNITSAGMNYLKKLTKMYSLVLTNANINDASLNKLKDMGQLGILNLSGIQAITDNGMKKIAQNHPYLNKLFMNFTGITKNSADDIIKLSHLNRFDFNGATIDKAPQAEVDAYIQKIKNGIPGIKIYH